MIAFTTGSYWSILIVHLVRRNQSLEGGEVSESIQAYGSATACAWLCSSIFGFFCIQTFIGLSGMRRNGVGQAWSNGMAVMLFILGVLCGGCVSPKAEGMMISWRAFGRYCLSRVFSSSFPLPIPHGDLRSRAGSCSFFFVLHTFYQAYAWGGGGLDFTEYTMVLFSRAAFLSPPWF